MPSLTQKQPNPAPERRRRFRFRPAYLILVLLMGFFAFKFVQKTHEIKTLTAQEVALQAQNHTLEGSRARVNAAIRQYRSPKYIEITARSVLGYAKPGETLVQVQSSAPAVERVRAAPAAPPKPPQESWSQWWSAFFG